MAQGTLQIRLSPAMSISAVRRFAPRSARTISVLRTHTKPMPVMPTQYHATQDIYATQENVTKQRKRPGTKQTVKVRLDWQ